jgi:hypothetical protein
MLAIPGIPFLGDEIEILLARRWKFCDEILFLFPSASGLADDDEAPVGSGVDTRGGVTVVSNVMDVGRRVCASDALLIERVSSDVGNASGAVSDVTGPPEELGNAMGSGSSGPDEGKETGSLDGTDGPMLSASTLVVGRIDGTRIDALGVWTEGAPMEAGIACSES